MPLPTPTPTPSSPTAQGSLLENRRSRVDLVSQFEFQLRQSHAPLGGSVSPDAVVRCHCITAPFLEQAHHIASFHSVAWFRRNPSKCGSGDRALSCVHGKATVRCVFFAASQTNRATIG